MFLFEALSSELANLANYTPAPIPKLLVESPGDGLVTKKVERSSGASQLRVFAFAPLTLARPTQVSLPVAWGRDSSRTRIRLLYRVSCLTRETRRTLADGLCHHPSMDLFHQHPCYGRGLFNLLLSSLLPPTFLHVRSHIHCKTETHLLVFTTQFTCGKLSDFTASPSSSSPPHSTVLTDYHHTLMSVDIRNSCTSLRFPSRNETTSRAQLSTVHTGDSTRPIDRG
jgi:hypothetical protein